MTRLTETHLGSQRSPLQQQQPTTTRPTALHLTALPLGQPAQAATSHDRVSYEPTVHAEAHSTVATGLPVAAHEPATKSSPQTDASTSSHVGLSDAWAKVFGGQVQTRQTQTTTAQTIPGPAPSTPPLYSKGPHYFCPEGFEGTALDPLRLAEQFMALPDELRGNFFNALCQYNAELGSALNSTLRDIRGEDVQKNWLTHMDTVQGSTFGAEGLPPWLLSALSTPAPPPAAPPPAAPPPPPATQTIPGPAPANPPLYAKGPSYWAPAGFEGTAQDPLRLAEEFMSLPEDKRGDYFNAVCNFLPMLGSALDCVLRDIRGAAVQKEWVNHMDTLQASTFKLEGLPAWLQGTAH